MEGLIILHEKHASGRSSAMSDINGRIKDLGGKYDLYCSFSKQLTTVYTDKRKGFFLSTDCENLYLVFVNDGYRLNSSGKNTVRGSFVSIISETPVNKDILKKYANKKFTGELVDKDTIKLIFEEE